MATFEDHSPKYEIDLVIRRLDDQNIIGSGSEIVPKRRKPKFVVTEEVKKFNLSWKQAVKIIFDKFL